MRKLLPWLVLAAVLVFSAAPALAVPVSDLNTLARYYPEDTAFYFSSQFGDGLFSQFDTLIQKVADALPPGADIDARSIVAHIDETMAGMGMSYNEESAALVGQHPDCRYSAYPAQQQRALQQSAVGQGPNSRDHRGSCERLTGGGQLLPGSGRKIGQ